MKILVTAFEPFGGEDTNPTLEIVYALGGIETLLLPVSFEDAPRMALQKIREVNPDAVVLLGQAGGRAAISLERVAINIADANNPDNDGVTPCEKIIHHDGPPACFCKLPLRALRDRIRQIGIPCHISNSAGTYVCNTLYYSVMQAMADLPVVLIHVPFTPQQAVNKKATTSSMNISDMIEAVNAAIEFITQLIIH